MTPLISTLVNLDLEYKAIISYVMINIAEIFGLYHFSSPLVKMLITLVVVLILSFVGKSDDVTQIKEDKVELVELTTVSAINSSQVIFSSQGIMSVKEEDG